jgi:nucleotide-binding universal stress UspA family protein
MRILVGTDGSEFGTAAVEQACKIAGKSKPAEIRVVSSYEMPGPVAAEPFVSAPMYTQEVIDGLAAAAQAIVDDAAMTINKNCPEAAVSTDAPLGRAAQVLLDEASSWHADLIVVGSHGLGFWGRVLLGSVSNTVVHHAPCSVLVVRLPKSEK